MNALVQSINEINRLKLGLMAGVAVLLLAFFIFISTTSSSPTFAPLYTNISTEDSGTIVQELDNMGVPYELSAGGKQIMVPANKVEEVRVRLAAQGLPATGSMVGYEIFNKDQALGTSNFVLNVNKLRALEGELARTISSIRAVDSARVHLVIPKREVFTRERRDPTASVFVNMRGANRPDDRTIAAIRHLVATGVTGLKPQRVTIIDNNGQLLARGVEDPNDPELLAAKTQKQTNAFEQKMEKTIERLLERSVGFGRVQSEVTADLDFDRIVTNSEVFDPEGQVARSVQNIEESEKENEKDLENNVTAGNNLPDADADNAGFVNSRQMERSDRTTNFEITKEVTTREKEVGGVKRLSVAVLVDGSYPKNEEGVPTYQPRSEEELAELEDLVRSAIGFDAERGDQIKISSMKFADTEFQQEPSTLDWIMRDFNSLVQTIILAVVALLVIMLVIRPLVHKAITGQEEEEEEERQMQGLLSSPQFAGELSDLSGSLAEDEETVSIDKIDGGIKSSLYNKVVAMIDSHPEESLNVLRQWAFESDE